MKTVRRLLAVWLFAALVLLGTGTALAAGETRIFDMAGLFSEEELEDLSGDIEALRDRMDMDVAVVTTEDNPGSAESFADRFYEEQGLGNGSSHDGVLFLIDLDNGELWISTEGRMLRYVTDARLEVILDNAFEPAADGDFYQAAKSFLADVETCYENGIAGDQYNYDRDTGKVSRYHSIRWYEFLFALLAAGACGGMAVRGVMREYNMRDDADKLSANFKLSYRKDSRFSSGNVLADVIIGSYITQQVISSAGRGGSGRSSGRGSLSSGGRTTTHRSSSGRTHGGGGRKFR